jgi:hypothetical protein
MKNSRWSAWAIGAALSSMAAAAGAQPAEPVPEPVPEPAPVPVPREDPAREQARAIFGDAGAAFQDADFVKAAELFGESHRVYPSPTALFWQGRSLAAAGKLVEAYARLDEAARWTLTPSSPEGFRTAVDEAVREREALSRRVPVIRVESAPDVYVSVSIDGEVVASGPLVEHRIDPGEHTVRATAPGREPFEVKIVAHEGDRLEVPVDLEPMRAPVAVGPATAPATTEPQEIAGWFLGGLGVGALVGWGVVGGLYLERKSAADDLCDHVSKVCDTQEGVSAVESAQTLGVASVALLVSGAVTLGTGITLLLTIGGGDEGGVASSLTATIGPGTIGIGGRF